MSKAQKKTSIASKFRGWNKDSPIYSYGFVIGEKRSVPLPARKAVADLAASRPDANCKDNFANVGSEARTPYVGWALDLEERAALMLLFPPTHPRVIAHHITAAVGAAAWKRTLEPARGYVVGYVDRDGIQALVVLVDFQERALDGRLFHITWSIDSDKSSADTNTVLDGGWDELAEPIFIVLNDIVTVP